MSTHTLNASKGRARENTFHYHTGALGSAAKGVIISGDTLRIRRVMGALLGSITAYAITTAGT